MADENKNWVKICKAKYFPNVGFWRARDVSTSSNMWRQVMRLRQFFVGHVSWQVGNGETISALSQPWFGNWTIQDEASKRDRQLKVCSLVDIHTGQWDMAELTRLFQPSQVQQIIAGQNKPAVQGHDQDKLVWHETKDGRYSVKEGYKLLIGQHSGVPSPQQTTWHTISKWKNIAPKVKIFLWRTLMRGLPIAVNMHSRFANFSPMCQRCHEENEYDMHCLFFCPTSRLVWFGCPIGIRVHELPLDITTTIDQIVSGLNEEGIKVFAYTIWEIWKERNKAVIQNCVFQPQGVLKRVNAMLKPELMVNEREQRERQFLLMDRYEIFQQGWQVLMDASWATSDKAACAYIVYDKGKLHSLGMHSFKVQDAFHAEAVALKEAMAYVYAHLNLPLNTTLQFFSDCLTLVNAVNQGDTSELPSWRATTVVNQIITRMIECQQGATLHHARREALGQVHELANMARRNDINYQGKPHMAIQRQGQINREIDERFFLRVQEAPP